MGWKKYRNSYKNHIFKSKSIFEDDTSLAIMSMRTTNLNSKKLKRHRSPMTLSMMSKYDNVFKFKTISITWNSELSKYQIFKRYTHNLMSAISTHERSYR